MRRQFTVLAVILSLVSTAWSAPQDPAPKKASTLHATVDGKTVQVRIHGLPRIIEQTDSAGNVISIRVEIPGPSPITSTTDAKTGITTTESFTSDGARIVTKTQIIEERDGAKRVIVTNDQGVRAEAVVWKDGSSLTKETDKDGNTVTIKAAANGAITSVETTLDGGVIETARNADGTMASVAVDRYGNLGSVEARFSDGSIIREDREGNLTASVLREGRIYQVSKDRNGNSAGVTRDAAGEIIARQERRATSKEPGQEYYETVLRGTEWTALPREAQIQFAEKEAVTRLAADRRQRDRDIAQSYDTAAKLKKQYAAAVARGDKAEAVRIQQEQDRHHDASMSLLELTVDEKGAMERKQAIRDRIAAQVIGPARAEAQRKVDEDWNQDLKESVTAGTKYVSIGSGLQQDTKDSTRLADFNYEFSEAKLRRLGKLLQDPKNTADEHNVINDMMVQAYAQQSGALQQLEMNKRLTAIGYTADVVVLVTTYGIGNGAAKLAGWLGKRSATRAAATKASQQAAAAPARASAAKTSGAVSNAVKATGRFLSKDVLSGAQAESKILKAMAIDTAVGAGVDAGVQLYNTGTIDPAEVVRAAISGGIMSGAMTPGLNKLMPKPARGSTPATQTAAATPPAATGPVPTAPSPGLGQLPSTPPADRAGLDALLDRVRMPEPHAAASAQPATPAPQSAPSPRTGPGDKQVQPARAPSQQPNRPAEVPRDAAAGSTGTTRPAEAAPAQPKATAASGESAVSKPAAETPKAGSNYKPGPGQPLKEGGRPGEIFSIRSGADKDGTFAQGHYRVGDTIDRRTDIRGIKKGPEYMIKEVPEGTNRGHMIPPQHGVNDAAGVNVIDAQINTSIDKKFENNIKAIYERLKGQGDEVHVTVTQRRNFDGSSQKTWTVEVKQANGRIEKVYDEVGYKIRPDGTVEPVGP